MHASLGHPVQPRVAAPRAGVRHPQDQRRRSPGSRSACRTTLALGNLDAKRDWGFAGDYVEAMWLMLQQPRGRRLRHRDRRDALDPRASSTSRSRHVGIDDWAPYVRQDPRFMRPAEVDLLIGDATQGPRACSAGSRKVVFPELVAMMVDADLAAAAGARRLGDRDADAFVTGITGQDGSYLAERLLAEGVEVHALAHADEPLPDLPDGVVLHAGDLDRRRRGPPRWCSTSAPDEIYNLAGDQLGRAVVGASPTLTARRQRRSPPSALLESALAGCRSGRAARCAFVQASSAEIFGEPDRSPAGRVDADPPGQPVRRRQGVRAPDGRRLPPPRPARGRALILYNHESPRRPDARSSPARSPRRWPRSPRGRADTLDARQPRRPPRLGLGARLRRRDGARRARRRTPTTT